MPAVDQEHKPEQGPVITLVPVFNRIQGKPVHVQEQTVVRIMKQTEIIARAIFSITFFKFVLKDVLTNYGFYI